MLETVLQTGAGVALWVSIAAAASLAGAVLYPAFRYVSGADAPSHRAGAQLIYGSLAPAAATFILLLIMLPEASNALVPDHCHDDVCGAHVPEVAVVSAGGFILASVAGLLSFSAGIFMHQTLRHARRRLRILRMLSEEPADSPYRLVETTEPVAWCAGMLSPSVYLSTGLLARLTPRQLRAVLAHEHAHAARRDNLRSTVLRWSTALWPRAARRELLGDFSVTTEQVCDLAAVRAVGDAQEVIALLGQLTEVGWDHRSGSRHAFDGVARPDRIRALLNQEALSPGTRPVSWWLFITMVWVVEVSLLTGLSHLAIEWLVGPVPWG